MFFHSVGGFEGFWRVSEDMRYMGDLYYNSKQPVGYRIQGKGRMGYLILYVKFRIMVNLVARTILVPCDNQIETLPPRCPSE